MICKAAVEKTSFAMDCLFTYFVPPQMEQSIAPGVHIYVPFGRGDNLRRATVFEVEAATPQKTDGGEADSSSKPDFDGKLKPVARVIDEYPPLSEEMLRLCVFMKEHCFCSYYDCVKTVQPPKVQETFLKEQKMVALAEENAVIGKLTPKQQIVLDFLQQHKTCSVKEIAYFTGCGAAVAEALVKKGAARFFYEKKQSLTQHQTAAKSTDEIILTPEQQTAFEEMLALQNGGKAVAALLYGITGSGKTLVFIKLIMQALQKNQSVILLVPEISLTPQTVNKFAEFFGQKIALLHSGLAFGERNDAYRRIANGQAQVIIGTRSAVFAPAKNLGLIIIDEEHEQTYKSESTPRYHARDIAKFRSAYNNCLLMLSSATPDVQTFYYAKTGRYRQSTLKQRYGNAVLPIVTTVDMNIQPPGTGNFSGELLQAVEDNLEQGKQTILLHNRRGYNTFVVCNTCKEPVTCPNCSISLTYHSTNHRLMCHYCGYSAQFSPICPSCGNSGLRLGGTGTQRAEDELEKLFPQARILRMDADATLRKNSHEKLFDSFLKGDYDILIGTQMVAKGLNFPNVTLVGVVNADQMLYADDYKSFERAFSLLTQVVGRSGRGDTKGRAIIQTHTPESHVISLAALQDYDAFYESEIALRQAMLYPPFADLCIAGFAAEQRNSAQKGAEEFLKLLASTAKTKFPQLPMRVLGPTLEAVAKINNKYRYRLMIKCRSGKDFRSLMQEVLASFGTLPGHKNTGVYIDFI